MRKARWEEIEPTRLKGASFAAFELDEVVRQAESFEWLILEVKTTGTVGALGKRSDETKSVRERLILDLAPRLPAHRMWDGGFIPDEDWLALRQYEPGSAILGTARIGIRRVISEQAVEAHLEELTSAAREYRTFANDLMHRLAQQVGAEVREFADDYSWHRHEQIGQLKGEDPWRYFFHGIDCAFVNLASGITIEARLGCGEDFGVLDPWFFLKFLRSTLFRGDAYRKSVDLLRNYEENVRRALEAMERRRIVVRLPADGALEPGWVLHTACA